MKIGIDIDEVVANFMENYLIFHNNKHKTDFSLEGIKNYHLWESGIHSSKEESINEVMEFQNSESFERINLIEKSKQSIIFLSNSNELIFVSSRPNKLKDKTFNFFNNHFPFNNFKFIFSGEIYGGKSKGEISKELGFDYFIEDNPVYAVDCAERGIKTFLLEKPWNKSFEDHPNIIKVKNWDEILEVIKNGN